MSKPRICYVCAKPREGVYLLCNACADRIHPKPKTYNPRNVRLSIGGTPIVGYRQGEAIEYERQRQRMAQAFTRPAPQCTNVDVDTGDRCAQHVGHTGPCAPF